MLKRIICCVICTALMLGGIINVYADGDVTISFNIESGEVIDFATAADTTLEVTASDNTVTDFDIYINDEFYEKIWGNPAQIDLKELDVLGLINISAKANGESGVLAEDEIDVFLKDAYIFSNDMNNLGTDVSVWPGMSATTGGNVRTEVIDAAHGKSVVMGTDGQSASLTFGMDSSKILRTDIKRVTLEFDALYTDKMPIVNLVISGIKDGVAKSPWWWAISPIAIKPNNQNLIEGEWHHFKYVIDLSGDSATLNRVVDDYAINTTYDKLLDSITSIRFVSDPTTSTYKFAIDNIEFYEDGITPAITKVTDSNDLETINYESEYLKVALTNNIGDVTTSNLAFIGKDGELGVADVIVDELDSKVMYVYPEEAFLPGEEYYLVIKKEMPFEKFAPQKDTYYKFKTSYAEVVPPAEEVQFNYADGTEFNLATEGDATITVTSEDETVTDFDIYINRQFYGNVEGTSADIDLKELGKYGKINILVRANDESGLLYEKELTVNVTDEYTNYIFQNDMTDFDGTSFPETNITVSGGTLEPAVIDDEHGTSLKLSSNGTLTSFYFQILSAMSKTGITSVTYEFDARYTGDLKTINLVVSGLKEDDTTKQYWNWPINAGAIKPGGQNLTADTWHHFKYVFDIETDTYQLIVDGNTLKNTAFNNELKCITQIFLCGDPADGNIYDFVIDNVEFYEEGVAPAITEIVDDSSSSKIDYQSEYIKVSVTDNMGNVLPENIGLINTNGEQAVGSVIVDEQNPKVMYVYPKAGFLPGEEYYLVIKKDTPTSKYGFQKDTYSSFTTTARDREVVGGVVIKQAEEVNFKVVLSNQTGDDETLYMVVVTNVNGVFKGVETKEILVPDGADNKPFVFPVGAAFSGRESYGFVVTNKTDITPISDKLFKSKAY